MSYPPIEDLVVHRAPMLLIDRVVRQTETSVTCAVELTDKSAFVESGKLSSMVMVEYMAQAIATYAGLHWTADGGGPKKGYLVGIRTLELEDPQIQVPATLEVTVDHVWGIDNAASFRGHVDQEGRTVARAELNVYLPVKGEQPP